MEGKNLLFSGEFFDSDDDNDSITWDPEIDETDFVDVAGVNGIYGEQYVPPAVLSAYTVLQSRIQKEGRYAQPKTPRFGSFRPPTNEEWTSKLSPNLPSALQKDLEPSQDIEMGNYTEPRPSKQRPKESKPSVAQEPSKSLFAPRSPKFIETLNKLANAETFLNELLDVDVTTKVRKILENSASLQELLFGRKPAKVSFNKDKEGRVFFNAGAESPPPPYKAKSPRFKCRLNDSKERTALLDTGAEINCISESCAITLGLAINPHAIMTMVASTGDRKVFIGICEDVEVRVGNTVVHAHLYVVTNVAFDLILGMPFIIQGSVGLTHREGGTYATIVDDTGRKEITLRVSNELTPLVTSNLLLKD